jgi:hypothetical protein
VALAVLFVAAASLAVAAANASVATHNLIRAGRAAVGAEIGFGLGLGVYALFVRSRPRQRSDVAT